MSALSLSVSVPTVGTLLPEIPLNCVSSASERWQQGDDLTAFNEELIYRETAAHELYKVTDMNDHKSQLSI